MAHAEIPSSPQDMESSCKLLQDHLRLRPLCAPVDARPRGMPSLTKKQQALHLVLVPYPLQGHINPMMQFAKLLVAKHHVKVSFVNIKHYHDRIRRSRARSPTLPHAEALPTSPSTPHHSVNASKMDGKHLGEELEEKLQLLWIENGLPDDFDYGDILPRLIDFHLATYNMKEPFKELLQSLNKKDAPISSVVFGSFCPWAHTVAVELGIPSFFFWTQSAAALSMYYHMPLLDANGFFPYNKQALSGCDRNGEKSQASSELVRYVPGVPPLRPSSFPTLLHVDAVSDQTLTTIREQFEIFPSCQGVIINSFEELEGDTYRALQEELPFPVSLVGPLIPSAFLDEDDANDRSVGASLFCEKTECMEWLDCQRKQSVLYISFGSVFNPPLEDLENIANGIKHSQKPFLWVIRPRSSVGDAADILPKGFIEDTKHHGLIIPWAPQVEVLSHPSVGVFLTHCGWNSTLESVSMGVPMICYPIISDQTTNCTYLCEFWKVGVSLKGHVDCRIKSSDVERAVRMVFEEEEGEAIRRRAAELKEAARRAGQGRGSSCIRMEEFIHSVRRNDNRKSNQV